MNNMEKYDTILFDLDGTLLNTLDDLTAAVNHVMDAFGYPERTVTEVRRFLGNGIRRLVALSVPDGEDNPDFEKAFEMFRTYYTAHCKIKTAPYAGIMELLKTLKQKGYAMAIVSNKNHQAVKELAQLYFEDCISVAMGQKEGIRRKPYPDMVEEALRIFGKEKKTALYVGDSEVDFATAQNAELDCVLVTWGFRDKEQLEEFTPVAMIDQSAELLDVLSAK